MTEIQELSKDLSETQLESQNSEKLELVAHLDELLEKYLRTLDEYDKAQRQLWKQLSSGYMSLAQANFNSGSSTVRYGPDYYDERMQAIRKVNITGQEEPKTGESRMTFSISSETNIHNDTSDPRSRYTPANTQEDPKDEKVPKTPETSSSESASPKETPPPQQEAAQSNQETEKPEPEPSSSSKANKSLDPIRWFGILVPPALRTAQSTFISAVERPIPQLATLARDLRSQEIEIGRVRKQIKKL